MDDNQYLIFVSVYTRSVLGGRAHLLARLSHQSANGQPLTVPELIHDARPGLGLHDVDMLDGSFPIYYPDTRTLTTLHAYRGMKDCGVFYTYHLEDAHFVLDEARYRECGDYIDIDILNAYKWPLVYPPPLTAGPFRKVTAQLPPLEDWRMNLQALPDGSLRLMTRIGYATYRDGQWETQSVDEEQTLVGVDADGRAWILRRDRRRNLRQRRRRETRACRCGLDTDFGSAHIAGARRRLRRSGQCMVSHGAGCARLRWRRVDDPHARSDGDAAGNLRRFADGVHPHLRRKPAADVGEARAIGAGRDRLAAAARAGSTGRRGVARNRRWRMAV